jgi:hypothetical protein
MVDPIYSERSRTAGFKGSSHSSRPSPGNTGAEARSVGCNEAGHQDLVTDPASHPGLCYYCLSFT